MHLDKGWQTIDLRCVFHPKCILKYFHNLTCYLETAIAEQVMDISENQWTSVKATEKQAESSNIYEIPCEIHKKKLIQFKK